jgi:lysophospholipase L1-like esterase
MLMISLMLLSGLSPADAGACPEDVIPAAITGDWTVRIGPGVPAGSTGTKLDMPCEITIAPPEVLSVTGEEHILPVFNPGAGGWMKGVRLKKLIAQECTHTGLLRPESVSVYAKADPAMRYRRGEDYEMDPFWGTIGRLETGRIGPEETVITDYVWSPCRLDTIAAAPAGGCVWLCGNAGTGAILPPALPAGYAAAVNIWIPGNLEKLTLENIYPIAPEKTNPPEPVAAKLLPETLRKLRAGERVTIVTFGDSCTNGGGVNNEKEKWYQTLFLAGLKKRFPDAEIIWKNAAWPGASSRMYLDAPPGGEYDYQRDVLDPRPDLVTIEFVNDAYLDEQGVREQYGKIIADIRGAGGDVILITPHLVRPDWLGAETLKISEDPRAYVRGLHETARRENVALADASAEWLRLWCRGIPYITLLANNINHPDARGHRIFADALLSIFPDE